MRYVFAMILAALTLSGCGGDGGSTPPEVAGDLQAPALTSRLIQIHDGVLRGQPYQVAEPGIETTAILTSAAVVGDTFVVASPANGFIPGQLVVCATATGEFYSAVVDAVTTDTIFFRDPIETALPPGSSIYNFYLNPRHPNRFGYTAIADFAAQELGTWNQAGRTHFLLGDSWLENGVIRDRFASRWPTETFINSGVNGDTVQDLISRFATDVTPSQPDYVWVVVGTNDYSHAVPTADFFWDMQQLVNMIKGIGAEAIIFDPSVGPLEYGAYLNGELKAVSDEYAVALQVLSL